MIGFYKTLPLWLLALSLPLTLCGQSILSEYAQNTNFPIQERLSIEKIIRISNSKKTFIISFENKGFLPGDFITLISQDQHVARAIVAKIKNNRVGIKIIKIYSPPLWAQLKPGAKIKVLRGDDSYFITAKKEEEKKDDASEEAIAQIVTNDDLFNEETLLQEDLIDDHRKKSHIKTDNILSGNVGLVATSDLKGKGTSDTHLNYSWNHQLAPNIWGELSYGFSKVKGFPDANLNTSLQTFTLRIKYTLEAPFYSYIKPYVGYKLSAAVAPKADTNLDEKSPKEQADLLKQIEYSGPIVGVTVLKRLVPGWFARADLGTDIINIGVALEF